MQKNISNIIEYTRHLYDFPLILKDLIKRNNENQRSLKKDCVISFYLLIWKSLIFISAHF
jgi:hypothetical protein